VPLSGWRRERRRPRAGERRPRTGNANPPTGVDRRVWASTAGSGRRKPEHGGRPRELVVANPSSVVANPSSVVANPSSVVANPSTAVDREIGRMM
jgi:hypothetical protein